MAARHRHFEPDPDETEGLDGSTRDEPEEYVKPWNGFKDTARESKSGSAVETKFLDWGIKATKVLTIILVSAIVLGGAVISKGTLLFMTSQIKKNVTRAYCNKDIDRNLQFVVTIPDQERATWIWFLIFAYFVPELGTFIRSGRKCLFKSWQMPGFFEFLVPLVTECCAAIGSALLIFLIFPELDVIKAAMLTNAVCFVPGMVSMFSRNACKINGNFMMILDIISVTAQVTSFVVWPLLEEKPVLYMIPLAVILISIGWWENFVSEKSAIPFIREIAKTKREFKNDTYFSYLFIAPIKCLVFLVTCVLIFHIREGSVNFMFDIHAAVFEDHEINVFQIEPIYTSGDYANALTVGTSIPIMTSYMTPIWVWIINFLSTYICYAFGKFACKIMVQNVSFAFPVNLAVPTLISGLIAMCGSYLRDECAFHDTIPDYLFFLPPPLYFLQDFISHQHSYIWLIWLLSQAWITVHIWTPNCEKLASTEKLFIKPMYDAFLIDQSLAMIRRRHERPRHEAPEKEKIQDLNEDKINPDEITRIYVCATMWHETREEMIEFLKSVFRLDQDQSAHRLVREYLRYDLDSYYTMETHIFFDDAFVRTHKDDNDPHVNEFVELLVSLMGEAAEKVHGTKVNVRPPKVYPTPYGGRLVWTLPGKTRVITHLKDRKKIRAKKRWSQVMYMYYLLGYKLGCNDGLSDESKRTRAFNTFILALDGDIDFKPEALHLLVEYMKKTSGLGAACGRIHPVGSGAMAWYQVFEYAVGHWFQKATEHVIGCVLCSPGCFSLFRASALMDDNVMRKYTTVPTEAKHYVQYDQGEDRWLCTLMLQRGYRVEYSAASDAYTHCPEGFNEFYNQRRRWMPSTMANIIDLLSDYEHVVKINENISKLYILYQLVLLIGTVLGPGTIFLMLVGAFVTAFGLSQWASFYWNLVPIVLFSIVCGTCSSDIQLFVAGLVSAVYGLVMMAVFVGVMLQINADGWLAPSSLFFFFVAGMFIFAAFAHPKEFYCLKYGIIYYVTVPSMYLLLVIYSVFNMNNVSWGTREVTVVPKPDANAAEPPEEEKKKATASRTMKFFGAADDDEGAFEFTLNKLFKCMFCTYRSEKPEEERMKLLQTSINDLSKKIETLESNKRGAGISRSATFMEGSKGEQRIPHYDEQNALKNVDNNNAKTSANSDDVPQNSWFYDGGLIRGEVHFLDQKEETFFNDLIDEYLQPIEDDKKKVSALLDDLRDKMVSTFFMLNALFVLVVFLLTLNKDILHINWPVTPKVNFTYKYDDNEIQIYFTYLELEPIGFVFLIFFGLLLVTQFFAMLVHRFGTFSQIITNTKLDFSLFDMNIDKLTEEELAEKDPLKIAKQLQRLKGVNDVNEDMPEKSLEARRTTLFQGSSANPRKSQMVINDLESAFKSRTENPNSSAVTPNNRKSVMFVQKRRASVKPPQSRKSMILDLPIEQFELQEPATDTADC